MDSPTGRTHPPPRIVIVSALLMAMLVPAIASGAADRDPADRDRAVAHLRTVDSRLDALIADGARRSPMFRTLVERLARSTVVVYVRSGMLPRELIGRLTFIGGAPPWRYLRIEIECRQSVSNQIAALGHELQHAVEIADREAAVDPPSIRALYGTIGFAVDDTRRRFESDAAKAAGDRVRRELSIRMPTLPSLE